MFGWRLGIRRTSTSSRSRPPANSPYSPPVRVTSTPATTSAWAIDEARKLAQRGRQGALEDRAPRQLHRCAGGDRRRRRGERRLHGRGRQAELCASFRRGRDPPLRTGAATTAGRASKRRSTGASKLTKNSARHGLAPTSSGSSARSSGPRALDQRPSRGHRHSALAPAAGPPTLQLSGHPATTTSFRFLLTSSRRRRRPAPATLRLHFDVECGGNIFLSFP